MAYQLPEWARALGKPVDLRDSPYWATQQLSGGGMGTLGNGDGSGYYDPLAQFAGQQVGSGDAQYGMAPDIQGANDWLLSTGQQLYEAAGGDNESARWLQDAQGNITALPKVEKQNDSQFWNAALLAGAVTGANLYGAGAGVGAAAPEAGIGTIGTIAPGAGPVAPLAATGQLSTAPMITASIPQAGGALAAGGLLSSASSGAGGLGGFGTSAPLEAGFSVPSFDAAGGANVGSSLFGNSELGQMGNGLLDYIKANPKIIGGLLGGLTGATGGLSGGSSGETYSGPMPTIQRGGWLPRVQAKQMAVPSFGAGLKTAQGNANSGLWRYNKG